MIDVLLSKIKIYFVCFIEKKIIYLFMLFQFSIRLKPFSK